jgi:hypothetical protein
MAVRRVLDLSTFDGRLLDGLIFCRKVYALFDQIKNGPDGVERLRMLKTKIDKRLSEELIPFAHYIQARYREGYRLKVRWFAGSQSYDGTILGSGLLVEHGQKPKKLIAEITNSMHPNDYLVREKINEGGACFGPKGISRDKRTGEIISEPYVNKDGELVFDLADQIMDCLKNKSAKRYPPETVLIINCIANTLIDEPEWRDAIERVKRAQLHSSFREVVLIDRRLPRVTTL